jgi:hypothetical protein
VSNQTEVVTSHVAEAKAEFHFFKYVKMVLGTVLLGTLLLIVSSRNAVLLVKHCINHGIARYTE